VAGFIGVLDGLGFEYFRGLEVMSTELRSVPVEAATKRVFDAAFERFHLGPPHASRFGEWTAEQWTSSAAPPRCSQIR
jgi:hypothetical protein